VRRAAAFCTRSAHEGIEPQDLLDALAHGDGISDAVLAALDYPRQHAPKPISIPDAQRLIAVSETLANVLARAREEAQHLGHNYVGTEHLLMALLSTNTDLFPDPAEARRLVLQILGRRDE
jgi:ATP-dependent Clp protease ATP-binding subunit ClpC